METNAQTEVGVLVDLALLKVMRNGLRRRSGTAVLRWGKVETCADGSGRQHALRSKTDQVAERSVLYLGPAAVAAPLAIRPQEAVIDPGASVFSLSASQISRRIKAATKMAGLGAGFSAHSLGVGTAKDLTATGRSSRSSWLLEDGKCPRCRPSYTHTVRRGILRTGSPGPRMGCFRRWSRRGDRGSHNRSSDRRT